jgi:hypothetical protein
MALKRIWEFSKEFQLSILNFKCLENHFEKSRKMKKNDKIMKLHSRIPSNLIP